MKLVRNPFVRLFTLSAITLLNLQNAQAAVRTWDGGHGSQDTWTQKQNWNNTAPVAGDDLHFFGPARLLTNNNGFAAATSFIGLTFDSGAGSFSLNGNSITLAGNVVNNGTNAQTINLPLILSGAARDFDAASGDLVVSGSGTISGSFGVNKIGGFALTLATANTYIGTTTISAGILLANNISGSATGTGAVSVALNGKLGGTGTIAPTGSNAISVSGVLTPGASVSMGNLTLDLANTSGIVAMAASSSFEYQLGAAGLNINTFGISDLLTITGASANDVGFTGNNIDLLASGGVGFYKLFDTSSDSSTTWTGLTVTSGTGVITSGLTTSNLASGLTGTLIMGGNSLGGTSGDIYLHVVPEPSAALLGGLGALFLLRRRRNA
jgi:autotransporter-associated beta strand protein